MILLDKNERQLREGDKVRMVGRVLMINSHSAQVQWDSPKGVDVGYILRPETLEVIDP